MPPETLDSLDKDELKPLVLALFEQNRVLLARVAELEARLGLPPKGPTNSSLPPSSGRKGNVAAAAPEQAGGEAGSRKRRRGRPGVARVLCADPDAVRDVHTERCACGASLEAADQTLAHAYDHIDLPPIKPITTRINLHRGRCPCCRKSTIAPAPADMPPGSPFGPGIVAVAAYLHGCHMVGYARLSELFRDLLGLTISQGAIANMLARTQAPFAAAAQTIAETVRRSPVIASDETSARVCGKTWWQWTFNTAAAVYHSIVPTRGKVVPTAFLAGARPEVWLSDRFAAQCRHAEAHQVCLAHLSRDAQYAIDAGDGVFAPQFKAFLKKACAIGRRRPELADATIARHARALRRELDRLLALAPSNAQGQQLRASIAVGARDKLLVFLTRRDVEPTNNASERALRSSVIFRKVTNCFRSHWGAKVYADLCSIVATGRLAGRAPLASLRTVLTPT